MTNKYIVILQSAWCNESGFGISYDSDLTEFNTRDEAKSYGFKLRDSDDFNIGVVSDGCLISFDWMETPVGDDEDVLAEIAESIGLFPSMDKSPEPLSEESLRNLIRQRHAEWSQATFGDVGPIGPLKHLSKEALEAAAEPDDLSEWADMQFLLWDAQRRAGISDAEITSAMEEKLKVNMARQWPEPKDGEPRLHIKEASNG